jgi:hypothetical protein
VTVTGAAEQKRLDEARKSCLPWKKWSPYLSERGQGVKECYLLPRQAPPHSCMKFLYKYRHAAFQRSSYES